VEIPRIKGEVNRKEQMYNLRFQTKGKKRLLVVEVGECQPPDREAGISWSSILVWNDKFQGEVIFTNGGGQLMRWNKVAQVSDIYVGEVSRNQLERLIGESRRIYKQLADRKFFDGEVVKFADVSVEEVFLRDEGVCGAVLGQVQLRDEEVPW